VKCRRQGSGQVVAIGFLQVRVIGIEPLDGDLQRAAGVEAARPRGAVDVLLGFAGGGVEIGPVGGEEGEVGHFYSVLGELLSKASIICVLKFLLFFLA